MSNVKNDIQDFGYEIKSSVNVATSNIKDRQRSWKWSIRIKK